MCTGLPFALPMIKDFFLCVFTIITIVFFGGVAEEEWSTKRAKLLEKRVKQSLFFSSFVYHQQKETLQVMIIN